MPTKAKSKRRKDQRREDPGAAFERGLAASHERANADIGAPASDPGPASPVEPAAPGEAGEGSGAPATDVDEESPGWPAPGVLHEALQALSGAGGPIRQKDGVQPGQIAKTSAPTSDGAAGLSTGPAPPAALVLHEARAVPLDSVREHPQNYRTHPDDQRAHIVQLLREFGQYKNVVVARDGTILCGHGVVRSLRDAGAAEVRVVRLDLDPEEPRALKLVAADNEVSRMAEVDDRALTELLLRVKEEDATGLLGTGLDDAMLANLLLVTRPKSEIRDLNEAAEWVGMPGLGEEGADQLKLVVTFTCEEDRERFVRETAIEIDKREKRTWSTRWPFTPRMDVDGLMADEDLA